MPVICIVILHLLHKLLDLEVYLSIHHRKVGGGVVKADSATYFLIYPTPK
jgi:hypothetical protein